MSHQSLIVTGLIACNFWGAAFVHAATVGYWRFENNLLDSSPQANNASATGTAIASNVFATPVPQTGAANVGSLDFVNNPLGTPNTGTANDYLEVTHDDSLNIAMGSFTIEAWIRYDNNGTNPIRQYVVQKKNNDVGDLLSSYIFMAKAGDFPNAPSQTSMALGLPSDGQINMVFSSLGVTEVGSTGWHFISVAVDRVSGDIRFTLDDQTETLTDAALPYTGADNNHSLYIGAHPVGGSANYGFLGGIDELRISNTFLPESELLTAVPEPASIATATVGLLLSLIMLMFIKR